MLSKVSNLEWDLQCQCSSDPNDRDGISFMEFCYPATLRYVSGEAHCILSHNARALISIAVTGVHAASL